MKRRINITIDMVKEYVKETRAYDKMCEEVSRASRGNINLVELNDRFMCMQNRIANELFGDELYDVIQWRLWDDGTKMTFDCDTDKQRDYVLKTDDDFFEMVEKKYLSGEKR